MLLAFDGNNSLKRLVRPNHQEIKKPFSSSYYLTPAQVDVFKDEVKRYTNKGQGNVCDVHHRCQDKPFLMCV